MFTPSSRLHRRHWLGIAASLSMAALAVRLMGRPWWCEAGDWPLWVSAAHSLHTSQHLFDPYTFTHILHGFGFYALLRLAFRDRFHFGGQLAITAALESFWEVIENTPYVIDRYRDETIALGYFGDSISNSMGDILACLLGFGLAARLPTRVTIALFLAIEGVLLLTIRDSLLLNVIMLIWPIEAIKHWQGQ